MRDPILFRRTDTLSPGEAAYWKDLFYRCLKIGTEIEVAPPRGIAREAFQHEVSAALHPSGRLDELGPCGVLDVTPEHCGIEVRVIGRQPHFQSLQKQYSSIVSVLVTNGARVRPTCGLHFHLLAPLLSECVPEIILANLWNLTRRYAPELRYITSGGDSRASLCRRRNHSSHLEMIRYSPANMSMREIQDALRTSHVVPEHQNFLNLEHLGFVDAGAVHPFHLEFRFPDMDMAPTSIAAKTFLFLALALKAIDLSQYGVIHVGKLVPWRRKTEILDMLSNNDGDLAASCTTGITDEIVQELRQGCHEMLDLLAPAFEWFHRDTYDSPHPAPVVLEALAEEPVSLMRCAGWDWGAIERRLADRARTDNADFDDTDRALMLQIELSAWTLLSSSEAWKWWAARELCVSPQDLEGRLRKLDRLRGLQWDAPRGTMVFGS